ncbi:MAG: S1 family peptidase [Proteobacteria bacterium]|nr:S1 family peptidase [Pseudomonadota bacterium]
MRERNNPLGRYEGPAQGPGREPAKREHPMSTSHHPLRLRSDRPAGRASTASALRRCARLVALLPALLTGACGPAAGDPANELPLPASSDRVEGVASRAQAIVGGDVTDAYPAVGKLKATGVTALCTATLVGRQTILTAAHCVFDYQHQTLATAVTFTLEGRAGAPGATFRGLGVKVHPLYVANDRLTIHDVAVVKLDGPPAVAPITVSVTVPPALETIEVVGYGVTAPETTPDGQLRVTRGAVGPLMPTYFDLSATGEGSFCHGDSGGPAFADGAHLLQIGIHSHLTGGTGVKCSGRGRDMRVDAYAQWIQQAADGDVALADVTSKELIPSPAGTVPEEYPLSCDVKGDRAPPPTLYLALGVALLLRLRRRRGA